MRQQLQLLLLIALVIALGAAGYRILFGSGPGYELVVVSAAGATAEVGGRPVGEIGPGTTLPVDSRVQTGEDGRARLQYGDNAELLMAELSSIQVVSADPTGLRVELESGTVSARVRQGAAPLNISNRGRSVGATDADFTVMVGSSRPLSVASQRGKLSLIGMGDQSILEPNTSLHTHGADRTAVLPITESLLFEVEWPEETKTRESTVEVAGTTDPYATVTLGSGPDAVRVRADRDGRFRATVPLVEGDNDIELRVRDVSGRKATKRQALSRDTRAPTIEAAEVVWGQ